jgi:formylglycine-generating enzyme required for sulfatase activity
MELYGAPTARKVVTVIFACLLTAVLVGGVASALIIHSRLGLSFFDIPGEAQLHDAPDDAQRRAAAAEDRVARAERAAETSETARDAAQKQRDEALKEADSAKRRIEGLQDENRALTMQRDNARNDLATERQDRARMDEALAKSYARIEDLQKQLTQPVVSFRDCSDCPEMVVVPSGRFTMGSPTSEPQRDDGEAQVPVLIARPYAVGKFAVTRGEFAVFATETGHKTDGGCLLRAGNTWKLQADRSWRSVGFTQDDRHPVVCISWNDAKAFAAWLSSKTGKSYRLPSEAEREYVTRAGTTTPFWWGSSITPSTSAQ